MDIHHVVAIFLFTEARFFVPADSEAEGHGGKTRSNSIQCS